MSLLPPGSYGLFKTADGEDGESFEIHWVDPQKASKPGYMWEDFGAMTEQQAKDELRRLGATDAQMPELFERARKAFNG